MNAIALDLDGTLLSCAPRQCALMRQLCKHDVDEIDPFIERYWAAKREGASNLKALRELGHPEPEARALAWTRDIEHWPWLGFDRLLPGVAQGLAMLDRDQIHVVLLTARREPSFLHQQLDRLNLRRGIDALVVVPPGEASAAKGRALQRLRPAAFIGDTESDAEAALAAGVPFRPLSSGMRSPTYWQQWLGQRQLDWPLSHDLPSALRSLAGQTRK
jgi:phosphoglycolate phosphatase-like HAD superfamily hydrolase